MMNVHTTKLSWISVKNSGQLTDHFWCWPCHLVSFKKSYETQKCQQLARKANLKMAQMLNLTDNDFKAASIYTKFQEVRDNTLE